MLEKNNIKMIEEIKIVDEGKRWQYAGTSSLEKLKYEEWLDKVRKEVLLSVIDTECKISE